MPFDFSVKSIKLFGCFQSDFRLYFWHFYYVFHCKRQIKFFGLHFKWIQVVKGITLSEKKIHTICVLFRFSFLCLFRFRIKYLIGWNYKWGPRVGRYSTWHICAVFRCVSLCYVVLCFGINNCCAAFLTRKWKRASYGFDYLTWNDIVRAFNLWTHFILIKYHTWWMCMHDSITGFAWVPTLAI